jgi:NitT/TauT family transport system permease protein
VRARRILPGRGVVASVIAPTLFFLLLVAVWQAGLFHALFNLKTFTVPYPDKILASIEDTIPDLRTALLTTLPGALLGYAVGAVMGVGLGTYLVLARPGLIADVLPLLSSVNSAPIVAIAPIVAVWVGGGGLMKVIVVIIVMSPTMTVYTIRGLTSVDPTALDLMRSLEARPMQLFRYVRLPAALPFIFTGLKASVVLALIGTIVSEVVRGIEGLGYMIQQALQAFQATRGWIALIAITVLGMLWYIVVEAIERIVAPWGPAIRSGEHL